MKVSPNFEEFCELSKEYDLVALSVKLTADSETPLSAYSKLSKLKPTFLFESVVGGEQVSRFSFLGFSSSKLISCFQDYTEIKDHKGKDIKIQTPDDPLKLIEDEIEGTKYHGLPGHRFSGGAIGYLSYEYASRIEPSIPVPEEDQLKMPLTFFMITEIVIIFDHAHQSLTICANASTKDNPEASFKKAKDKIRETLELLSQPSRIKPTFLFEEKNEVISPSEGNFSKSEFMNLVEKTKRYIREGDIIQAVLSQRFSIPFEEQPIDLYRAIRAINPSPYMFILETDDFSIVGASPEVHVRLNNGQVLIRPIAGTRPRGKNEEVDLLMEKELLADEKEKAEHLMLVDLARNDIGRVCESGSVKAAEFMSIERYSHVMHIVSQVTGKLLKENNAFDLMRATFPAGTVSGAPKIRAMQIIAEFENLRRNAYAGALGYFGFEGNHDSCIAIRTAIIKDKMINIQAGAGIVADSCPEMEFKETINKAKSMLHAVKLSEKINN
mgnify:CR=1 FL=1